MSGNGAIDVDGADFTAQVIERSREVPVVVDFWAGWCRPCLVLGPVLEDVAAEKGDQVVLAKVDVDANPAIAARYGVQGIPAVKAFVDGKVVSEFVGVQPENTVRMFFEALMPSPALSHLEPAADAEQRGDLDAAEAAYRTALEADPRNEDAAVGLARVLLDRGADREARTVLSEVPGSQAARPLLAEFDLKELADGSPVGLAASKALDSDREGALAALLEIVRSDEDHRDDARMAMVAIFDLLGDDHDLTREYRSRLAGALF